MRCFAFYFNTLCFFGQALSISYEFPPFEPTIEWFDGRECSGGADILNYKLTRNALQLWLNNGLSFDVSFQANETEDVLSVYNRLVDVQEQIELIKGQMQYYEQSAALSAISVNIQANEAVQPLKIGNWQPVGVAKRAIQALINTLELIANLLIWVALYILPVVLVLYFPIRWIWKGLKRLFSRGKKKKGQDKTSVEKEK